VKWDAAAGAAKGGDRMLMPGGDLVRLLGKSKFMNMWVELHRHAVGSYWVVRDYKDLKTIGEAELNIIIERTKNDFIFRMKCEGYEFDEDRVRTIVKKHEYETVTDYTIAVKIGMAIWHKKPMNMRKKGRARDWMRRDTNRPGGRRRSYGTAARN
jgi:hypothetical protein